MYADNICLLVPTASAMYSMNILLLIILYLTLLNLYALFAKPKGYKLYRPAVFIGQKL